MALLGLLPLVSREQYERDRRTDGLLIIRQRPICREKDMPAERTVPVVPDLIS